MYTDKQKIKICIILITAKVHNLISRRSSSYYSNEVNSAYLVLVNKNNYYCAPHIHPQQTVWHCLIINGNENNYYLTVDLYAAFSCNTTMKE